MYGTKVLVLQKATALHAGQLGIHMQRNLCESFLVSACVFDYLLMSCIGYLDSMKRLRRLHEVYTALLSGVLSH